LSAVKTGAAFTTSTPRPTPEARNHNALPERIPSPAAAPARKPLRSEVPTTNNTAGPATSESSVLVSRNNSQVEVIAISEKESGRRSAPITSAAAGR
jgi:hypothetical protein